MTDADIKKIEKIIHYSFKNKQILKTAFTHSSYANEYHTESNERLEFLGDSILDFVVADELFCNFNIEEGKMTKLRAKLVNGDALANIVEDEKLGQYIQVGRSLAGQEIARSIKENLFESLVGAIYSDSSLEKAKRFVLRFIDVAGACKTKDYDYKTMLQEEVQKVKGANLVYFTYSMPNNPGLFCAEAYINDVFVARSTAETKKHAQMDCAKRALENKEMLRLLLVEGKHS